MWRWRQGTGIDGSASYGGSLKELQLETFVFLMNINCHGYKMSFPEVKATALLSPSIPTYDNMHLNYGISAQKPQKFYFSELYNQVAPPCY